MSRPKCTQKQLWIILLLLMQLLAMIQPAGVASAATPGPGCEAARGQTASAASLTAPLTVASVDEKVVIPKEKVDLAVFTANWRKNLDDAHAAPYVVFNTFDMYADRIDPNLGEEFWSKFRDEAQQQIDKYSQEYQFSDNNELIVHAILNLALEKPELAPAVPYVWRRLMAKGADDEGHGQRIGVAAQNYDLNEHLLNISPEILAAVYECAHEIPAVARAFDEFHSKLFNVSILDDAKTILDQNPDLVLPEGMRDHLNEDGTITISLDDLKALSEIEFAKINSSIDDMQKTLVEIDKKQNVLIDYMKNQQEREKMQALAQAKAAEHQLKLDAAKSTISIIATLAGQIDPKFARDVSVVGFSTLKVGLALDGWLKAVSGLKGLDKVTSLSTVIMTGNVLGAVMNVVALFGDQQPTPDQIILEEIGKLRQQVDQLRQEMHSRFDRIDQELNAIYSAMHDRFDQIDLQLGKINGNILEVQQSLAALDLHLSRIERNNFEFLNTLGRRPLLNAINGGLGYQDRTGSPMPFQPEFVNFENELQSWGAIHAYDPVNAGPTQRDYSDGQMMAELNAYPLDSNINYLNGWLVTHGLPPISNQRLASPRDWLFAGRAYTQLGIEWPQHMKKIDHQRQAELDQVGDELEAAMHNISTLQTTNGPVGNSLLFTTVITLYQDKLDALNASIQSLESNYIDELRANSLQRSEAFDLYGGIDQPLTYVTPELTNMTCGNADLFGSHPAPSNLKSLIPNFDRYALADYLRLGKLKVCAQYQMADPILECHTEQEPPFDEHCDEFVSNNAVLTLYFDNLSLMSQTIMGGVGYLNPDWYLHYGELEPNWSSGENYKAQFEALTTVDTPSPDLAAQRAALLDTITTKLETTLAGYQQRLYGRVINEMTQGSLKALANETAGSKALLDSFVTLGLPRAVSNDEFLHALLFGNQQLLDDSQIVQSYALSATQPITGANLTVNPRLLIQQQAGERVDAVSGLIDQYLDAITAKSYTEEADYLASTHRAFDLTMRIAQMDLPIPVDAAIAGLRAFSNSPTPVGRSASFSATLDRGSNVSYAWDFGDGNTAIGIHQTHTYNATGLYTVRLTASNSVSNATVTLQVEVALPTSGQSTTQLYLPTLNR